ncbi:hypothetical protein ACHHYP_17461 [Achlya hypogyna]|uniref:Uncharacterized protein n=1 Tax=Achlya hypogyna TaxID=1202772 RepID=A0A1V9Y4G4_ACHHY|nr:hypothetical protein ACHHYP_17461 [Achlya hypogyna]
MVLGVRRVHIVLAVYNKLSVKKFHTRLALILFTRTCWLSCLLMLSACFELTAPDCIDVTLEPTILDREVWKRGNALNKLLASVTYALSYLERDETTHSAIFASFFYIAVVVKNLGEGTPTHLGVDCGDGLLQAVYARFKSICSPSFALTFVTDPFYLDMHQRLTVVYGVVFVELGQESLSEQCYAC